ncbi:hypothetical protein [Azospirillum sp. SYSU D00513]|uniref:hypothetical protein n=1 Tax=Azospirillum sp. SYSU D00513 TaxID=2812561 RepID=UPI001A95BC1B|nr:hypothetical protein [Azospirillum sp. SYSU D00513]
MSTPKALTQALPLALAPEPPSRTDPVPAKRTGQPPSGKVPSGNANSGNAPSDNGDPYHFAARLAHRRTT